MRRSDHPQVVPFIAAFVEADPPLGLANQLILFRFQLKEVHVEPFINGACVEQELVGGDGEQGPGQLCSERRADGNR